MSQEFTTPDLVELNRRLREAANRRDFDAVASFFSPDSFYESVGLGTSFRGRTAIRGVWEDMTAPYEEFQWYGEEVLDLGNGVIFVLERTSGRMAGSTSRVEELFAIVAVWEKGLIVRSATYKNIDQARAAAERLAEERG